MVLPRSFYIRPNVVQVAIDLLGKKLCTRIGGHITSGIICETEAYAGVTDKASHAFGGRRTGRTEIMYSVGGTAYVYLCYGIHSLFNVVTNAGEIPHAVLIRGIIPATGTDIMLDRTGLKSITENSGIGPGKVSKILGIHYSHSGIDLVNKPGDPEGPSMWIEDIGITVPSGMVETGKRVGVDYAGTDSELPYRFRIQIRDLPALRDQEGLK